MTAAFALAGFLARWHGAVRFDLSASESETLPLSGLLALAEEEDLRRWERLGLGYADPQGAPWLRRTIASRYRDLDAEEVLCCAGAQEAVSCTMRALLQPGDHAVVVVPIYQPSEAAVTGIAAATGVPLEEGRDGAWHLDVGRVAQAIRPETRLILMNVPNSPTGAVLDAETLQALVALCRRHGLWLVNDEVYRHGETDPATRLPPVVDLYERGVSIEAVSKSFGLPGLRTGWVAARDPALLARIQLAKSMLSSCLTGPGEVLAHIALQAGDRILARNRAIGRANRQAWQAFRQRHADYFDEDASAMAAFAFPRYRGAEGADRFVADLARRSGILLLPSSLWRSPLAEVPLDRFRIGLGRGGIAPALQAFEAYLTEHPALAAIA
jgi:aspartate/methionine/tyrosine aminotransferase